MALVNIRVTDTKSEPIESAIINANSKTLGGLNWKGNTNKEGFAIDYLGRKTLNLYGEYEVFVMKEGYIVYKNDFIFKRSGDIVSIVVPLIKERQRHEVRRPGKK